MSLKDLETKFTKLQFSGKDRLRLYRKVARFLRNGVPISQALDIMWNHASDDGKKPKAVQAVVIDEWRKKIKNGASFGRAIEGWVPDKDRIVIEAGETAGRLDTAIENAVFIYEGSKKIRSAIISGLSYPAVLVMVAIGFIAMFGIQIVPAFDEVLPRDQWTGMGAQMAMMADFVHSWLIPSIGAMFAIIGAIVWSLPRWTGRARAVMDRYPPWSIYRLTTGSGFMLAVSGMVKAGVPIPTILRTIQRGATPWYQERIAHTLWHVNNGLNLGDALHKTGFGFPDIETVKDLRAYAALDGFDETLEVLGREWMEDSVARIEMQTGILRNASFILLGGVFGWIATGLFSLQQQIVGGL